MTHTTRTIILLFFGLFGLGIAILYISSTDKNKTSIPEQTPVGVEQTLPSTLDLAVYEQQAKNALITVPDTNIKLSLVDGRASYGTTLDGGDVTLVKVFGGEKVSTGSVHIFADIVVQSGGTGAFHYVGLFDVTGDKAVYLASYFIGDRVTLVSASTTPKDSKSYILTISYLDRKEGEPMVEEPTVLKEIKIEVRNNLFIENSL